MARRRLSIRFAVAASVVLLAIGLPTAGTQAQSQSNGDTLEGLWHANVPLQGGVAITALMVVHQGGTVAMIRDVDKGWRFGAPPDRVTSQFVGTWKRSGQEFEGLVFNYRYAFADGTPQQLNRLRFTLRLDGPDFDSASGAYWIGSYTCPAGVCPDPSDSTLPLVEQGPFVWTVKRIRMP